MHRLIRLVLLVAMLSVAVSAQGQATAPSEKAPTARTDNVTSEAAASHMRLILMNIATYDQEQKALPKTLEDLVAAKITPDGGVYVFRDPRTGKTPGFVCVKPPEATRLAEVKSPADTPLLYELKDGQPDRTGLIGYADGHVVIPPPREP